MEDKIKITQIPLTNKENQYLLLREKEFIEGGALNSFGETFDFEGKETPCIVVDEEKYGLIRAKIEGQPFSVNTDLNILQDGLGNVFVEVVLTFSIGNISEKDRKSTRLNSSHW